MRIDQNKGHGLGLKKGKTIPNLNQYKKNYEEKQWLI